jgi:hypothetical protein
MAKTLPEIRFQAVPPKSYFSANTSTYSEYGKPQAKFQGAELQKPCAGIFREP